MTDYPSAITALVIVTVVISAAVDVAPLISQAQVKQPYRCLAFGSSARPNYFDTG